MGGYHEYLVRTRTPRAMLPNSVTQAHVDAQIVDVHVSTVFDKVTVVSVRLRNGFVMVESAGAVDKANYREHIGREICLTRIKNRIWEMEGYQLSTQRATAQRQVTLDQVRHALSELNQRVHGGYDFNTDPDGISRLVGEALAAAQAA